MASISTSLNSLLASNFSDFGRIGQGVNRTFDATKPQMEELRQQLGGLKEGTTVSARFDYRVGPNGQMVQTGATVTTRTNEEEQRRQQQQFQTQADERQQSFADLAKPKAQLAPSDELALFAADAADEGFNDLVPAPFLKVEAEDENGEAIEVEVLAPETDGETAQSKPASGLLAQMQQRASALYARNYDLQFTIDSAVQFAA